MQIQKGCFWPQKISSILCVLFVLLTAIYGCGIKSVNGNSAAVFLSPDEKTKLADELHIKGLTLYEEGQYEEAIEIWRKEIELTPARPKPYNNIGITYRKLENLICAIEYHKKAIRAGSKFGHTYYSIGLAYFDLKNYEMAKDMFLKAIKSGYANADVYFSLGQAYKRLKNYEKAVSAYEKTAELYYNYPGVHYHLGDTYSLLGKFDIARLELKREVSINPKMQDLCDIVGLEIEFRSKPPGIDDIEALFLLGMMYYGAIFINEYEDDYLEKAINIFQKIKELNPSYLLVPMGNFSLGQLYEKKGDFHEAEKMYMEEIRINPESDAARIAVETIKRLFDYSSYTESRLKEIGDYVSKNSSVHESGLDIYTNRLKIRIHYNKYPEVIGLRSLKALEFYGKTIDFLSPNYLKLFTHQLDVEVEGDLTFILVLQRPLVARLQKELRPGDYADLYSILGIYDYSEKRVILIVNEFNKVPNKFDPIETNCE